MSTACAPPTTLPSLKDYVSGSSSMQQSAESTVQLFVTHCHLKAQFPEIRLDKHVSNRHPARNVFKSAASIAIQQACCADKCGPAHAF